MIFLAYIICGIIFSFLGYALVWFAGKLRVSYQLERFLIWFTILSSVILPFLFLKAGTIGTQINTEGETLRQFCHCQNPGASEMIHFQATKMNEMIGNTSSLISFSILFIGSIFFAVFTFRLFRILRYLSKNQTGNINLFNTKVKLVKALPEMQAGSFRLFHKYILWNEELDRLPEKSKSAIQFHELSHLKQFNSFEIILLSFVQLIWWMNPVFYFFRARLQKLSEFIADEYAVNKSGDKIFYAHLILNLKKSQPVVSLQHFNNASDISSRIYELFRKKKPGQRMLMWFLIPVTIFLGSGELIAAKIIKQSVVDYQVYDYLAKTHEITGQTKYCKTCSYENALLGNCYIPQ